MAARIHAQAPAIVAQPVSPTSPVTLGTSVNLSVRATGASPLTYQWQLNGVNIPSATAFSHSFRSFQAENGGSYRVVVANSLGTAYSTTAKLVPNVPLLPFTDELDAPEILRRGPANQLRGNSGVGGGSNVRMTVDRTAGEPLHAGNTGGASVWLAWVPSVSGIASFSTEGSTFDTLLAVYTGADLNAPVYRSLKEVASSNDKSTALRTSKVSFNVRSGQVYFIAVDGRGSTTKSLTTLTRSVVATGDIVLTWNVQETLLLLPVFTTVLVSKSFLPLAPVSIPAAVDLGGADSAAFLWSQNGVPLPNQLGSSLVLDSITRSHVGTYFCDVTTTKGGVRLTTRSKEIDLQISQRSDNTDTQVLAEDSFASAVEYSFAGASVHGSLLGSGTGRRLGLAAGTSGTQIFNTKDATTEEGEPLHCGVAGGHSEWYTIQTAADGILVADTVGSDYDTVLAAYFDNGTGTGLFDGLVNVACNNNAPGLGTASRISFPCQAGKIYYLAVDGPGGIAQINYRLGVPLRIVTPPIGAVLLRNSPHVLRVIVEGVGTLRYQWIKDGVDIPGAIDATLTLPPVQPPDSGRYRVRVTDDLSSTLSSEVVLVVQYAPIFTQVPAPQLKLKGETAVFTALAEGVPAPTYAWFFNGSPLGITTPTLNLPGLQLNQAGNYTVSASNVAGVTPSPAAALTVHQIPAVTLQLGSQTHRPGETATFQAAATGFPAPSFQWQFKGVAIPGATAATLTRNNVQAADAGPYRVVVTNPAGSATSDEATLTLDFTVAPSFTLQPVSLTRLTGETATFSVLANGTPTPTLQWYFNNAPLSVTDPSLTLLNLQLSKAGEYYAVANNSKGSVTSSVVTLTLYQPPTVTLQLGSQTHRPGETATFQAAATGFPAPSFQWQFKGVPVPGATAATLTRNNVQAANAGTYRVVVTNPGGSATSDEATLTLDFTVAPSFTLQPVSLTRLTGETATFNVQATGTPAPTFQWYFNNAPLSATDPSLTLLNLQLSKAGEYYAVANNSKGSVTSSVVTLTLYQPPTVTLQPLDQTIRPGFPAIFKVWGTGIPVPEYQWLFNQQVIAGANSSNYVIPKASLAAQGTYRCVVFNTAGTNSTEEATLEVHPSGLPTMQLNLGANGILTLSAQGLPSVPYQLQQSIDLTEWEDVFILQSPSGQYEMIDSLSSSPKWYRLIPPLD